MSAAGLNVYIEGSRVRITASTETLPEHTLTTPTTWRLVVRNLADGETLEWSYDGTAELPIQPVEASMDNPEEGVIEFEFNVDTFGKRAVWFGGTGACKCAAEIDFMVKRSEAL